MTEKEYVYKKIRRVFFLLREKKMRRVNLIYYLILHESLKLMQLLSN